MRASREVILTLNDVEESIRLLEEKYQISTLEFLAYPATRSKVTEDDIFEWEAFIEHRSQLRELSDDIHRKYLSGLAAADWTRQTITSADPRDLAA